MTFTLNPIQLFEGLLRRHFHTQNPVPMRLFRRSVWFRNTLPSKVHFLALFTTFSVLKIPNKGILFKFLATGFSEKLRFSVLERTWKMLQNELRTKFWTHPFVRLYPQINVKKKVVKFDENLQKIQRCGRVKGLKHQVNPSWSCWPIKARPLRWTRFHILYSRYKIWKIWDKSTSS